ncbi:glutathione S-transferase family protein [Marinicella sp. W31]|uniref:glutathione S-transferase family protein n=1 Tax=Marinicella sp. W31 TaxID=3023713 RepID=UPI0037579892
MQESQLKLYAYTFRTRAERVIWALQELQLPFELIRLDPMKGETRDADFLKLNSTAKVPVLLHGEQVFTESLAIMEYVNTLSNHIDLVPQDAMPQYKYRQLMYYLLSEVESYLWVAEQASRLKRFYPWPGGTYEECMSRVSKGLTTVFEQVSGQTFAIEGQFSLADIYIYQVISWAHSQGVEIPDAVIPYMSGLEKRSAFPEIMLWKR